MAKEEKRNNGKFIIGLILSILIIASSIFVYSYDIGLFLFPSNDNKVLINIIPNPL